MKHNKKIYLTAFLLSISLILLLEASSLRLLAEDIKPIEKKEVEIELLLSASNELGAKEAQTKETEEIQTKSGPATPELNEEAAKNSSVEKKEEVKEEKEQFLEDKIIEKKEPPKKIVNKIENKEKEPDKQYENSKSIEKTELEKETEKKKKVEVPNELPAWMQNSSNNTKKEKSVEKEEQNKKSEFDLDSFIANLEVKENLEKNSKTTKEIKEASVTQANNSSTLSEVDKSQEKNNIEKNEKNTDIINSTGESNQNNQKNKVYDLRNSSSDSFKKPGLNKFSQPEYPSNLRQRNIEGRVIVSLRIDNKGQVHDLKISQSSGYDSFDQAALKAVRKWTFKAAEKEGKKVEVIINLPIRFQLN